MPDFFSNLAKREMTILIIFAQEERKIPPVFFFFWENQMSQEIKFYNKHINLYIFFGKIRHLKHLKKTPLL